MQGVVQILCLLITHFEKYFLITYAMHKCVISHFIVKWDFFWFKLLCSFRGNSLLKLDPFILGGRNAVGLNGVGMHIPNTIANLQDSPGQRVCFYFLSFPV